MGRSGGQRSPAAPLGISYAPRAHRGRHRRARSCPGGGRGSACRGEAARGRAHRGGPVASGGPGGSAASAPRQRGHVTPGRGPGRAPERPLPHLQAGSAGGAAAGPGRGQGQVGVLRLLLRLLGGLRGRGRRARQQRRGRGPQGGRGRRRAEGLRAPRKLWQRGRGLVAQGASRRALPALGRRGLAPAAAPPGQAGGGGGGGRESGLGLWCPGHVHGAGAPGGVPRARLGPPGPKADAGAVDARGAAAPGALPLRLPAQGARRPRRHRGCRQAKAGCDRASRGWPSLEGPRLPRAAGAAPAGRRRSAFCRCTREPTEQHLTASGCDD
mmetsp:Transcript_88653/g.259109  ORF Transcript_88653/g.259109 Transcript_88653/m.259109 type:complete len:327 (-) Transcript_88653:72-1052(-)